MSTIVNSYEQSACMSMRGVFNIDGNILHENMTSIFFTKDDSDAICLIKCFKCTKMFLLS